MNFKTFSLAVLILFLFFIACSETDSGTNPDDTNGGGDQVHDSYITKDETWTKDKVHIISGYVSVQNATVTIEPGTVIKFNEKARLVIGEAGGLIADGTSGAITFTGGVKQNGYWYYIEFQKTANSSASKLINCLIEYGGGYSASSSILRIYNHATVKNCTIKNSSSSGVYIGSDAQPDFSDNTVTTCDKYPIEAFFNSANYIGYGIYNGNSQDFIFLNENDIVKNTTIRNQEVPYILDGYNTISNATLTIEEGTIIMMNAKSRLIVGENGGLIAKGTTDNLITFTGTVSQKGYWYYIEFAITAVSANSILDYCKIEYGGGYSNYSAMVNVYNNATITNCLIQNSSSNGIHLDDTAMPLFHDNTITLNELFPVEASMKNITFIGKGNYTGNASGHDNIFIENNTYSMTGTLLKQDVPYVLDGLNTIENGTLTVEPGTQIQMNAKARLVVGTNGGFIADGATKPITITGYVQQNGYWYYIEFNSAAKNSECVLNNCLIEYGGGYSNYSAIVRVKNGGTVTNNTIQHSSSYGLYYVIAQSPVISGNTFTDNAAGDIDTY